MINRKKKKKVYLNRPYSGDKYCTFILHHRVVTTDNYKYLSGMVIDLLLNDN